LKGEYKKVKGEGNKREERHKERVREGSGGSVCGRLGGKYLIFIFRWGRKSSQPMSLSMARIPLLVIAYK
jgi:hypothetical protein